MPCLGRYSRRARLAGLLTPFAALGVVVADPAEAEETPVSISFTGPSAGETYPSVANEGSGVTAQSIVATHGGRLVARDSGIGTGMAARFPAYDGAADGPRAVVSVTNAGDTDQLTPGTSVFSFGADVRLDATSSGTTYDNGNNVVQRGLATQAAQYKLQLDGGRFSCRVRGDAGALTVTSSLSIRTGAWYRAACRRTVTSSGDRLVLTVTPVKAGGALGATRRSESPTGPCGQLSFAIDTPFSVGGKLTNGTTVASASDQFNGRLDSVFVTVG